MVTLKNVMCFMNRNLAMLRKSFHQFFFLLFIFYVLINVKVVKAQQDSTVLTLDRIYSTDEFSIDHLPSVKWMDDGSVYTILEESKDQGIAGKDIVRYKTRSGKHQILVSSQKLIPPDSSKPLKIASYSWSKDKRKLLIFTNTKRVWRVNTKGDYWVLNVRNWQLEKLGGDAKPSTLMFAKFSPDGNKVAYVRQNDIYVEDLTNDHITQLTNTGSDTVINGTFDWVYEEEFRLRDGFRWSPNGKYIAYWQLNNSDVGIFHLINNTDSLYPKLISFRYPKAGTTNPACRVGVIPVVGGDTQWMQVSGSPRNHYIAYMDWASNSKEIVFQRLNRLQNTNHVILGNARTGEVRSVFTDRDSAWLDVVNDLYWLDDGKQFTWVSEMDGWRHVYMISRSGDESRLITLGNYDVITIVHIDKKDGWLYYMASPKDPTERYLYRTRLDGNEKAQRLTPENQSGTHRYRLSPNSKWAFHTYSTFNHPPKTDLISLPNHQVVRTLVDNAELQRKVNNLQKGPVNFFRVDIGDDIILDGWQMKPPDYDPKKKYPVLFYVYGEPWGQTVRDRWGNKRYLWHLMLTQQGYIVMSIDNRGTPAPRGRKWRKCIYEKIGVIASSDQAKALQKILKWNYVDSTRIGIWGWSGGGSMTLNMMFRYPNLYHTGMAVAPVPDIHLYDTIYQERYMGLPQENEEAYVNSSPITFAHQLKGNLLLVHGTGDDNVHYQGTENLINELIEHNKPFSMMAYPNRSHGIYEGKNTTRHLFGLLTRYLHEYLPPAPK